MQILGFDGMQALDIFGPLEALASVQVAGRPAYKVRLVGLQGRRFSSETGIVFEADFDTSESGTADTFIVPGGSGLRRPDILDTAADGSWLRPQTPGASFQFIPGPTLWRRLDCWTVAVRRRTGASSPIWRSDTPR